MTKKSKITIEFDKDALTEQKRVPNGKKSFRYKTVNIEDPKAWEVITVENSMTFSPGYRLNKKQVEALCKDSKYDVQIGMPGQFRKTNSRY
tara:strand:- start:1044 stop:1316 length:273 start_codon:yes stop_codon:yes gene_type:complete